MNIKDVANKFIEFDNELRALLHKSDSLADSGEGKESWERYKELEEHRRSMVNDLFVDSVSDDMYDYVHDSILDDGTDFPTGYTAFVFASYYNSIMRYYNTIAFITTPTGGSYFIGVPTYNRVNIGTEYIGN
jgi:hypothetical protein